MKETVVQAYDEYETAAKRVIDAVRKAYPVGAVVRIGVGGHIVSVEVIRHSDNWWHRPGEMFGVNVKTGKVRRFSPANIVRPLRLEAA